MLENVQGLKKRRTSQSEDIVQKELPITGHICQSNKQLRFTGWLTDNQFRH